MIYLHNCVVLQMYSCHILSGYIFFYSAIMIIIFSGDRLKGWDVVKSGIATHYIPSKRLYELEILLSRATEEGEINNLLSKFHEPSDQFTLSDNIKHINYCFAASSIEEIIERLEKVQNDWSVKTLKVRDWFLIFCII